MTNVIITLHFVLFRDAIEKIISQDTQQRFTILQTTKNFSEIKPLLFAHTLPDVIICDTNTIKANADSFEYIFELKNQFPQLRVMIVCSEYEENILFEALHKGIKGCVDCNTPLETMLKNIIELKTSGKSISMDINKLLKYTAQEHSNTHWGNTKLDENQIKLLQFITEGLSDKEITSKLNYSPRGFQDFKSRLKKQLQLKRQAELVKYAFQFFMHS